MPRWTGDTRERLIAAAYAKFAEQGFEASTVDAIAREAGVTERTFYRHFADKEEVLFAEDGPYLAVLTEGVAGPPTSPVRAAVGQARRLAPLIGADRAKHVERARVIGSSDALLGRHLLKLARWRDALGAALIAAGHAPREADAAARFVGGAFEAGYTTWIGGGGGENLDAAFTEALTAWFELSP